MTTLYHHHVPHSVPRSLSTYTYLKYHRPQEDAHCQWKAAYKYFNIVLDGLQGLIVSVAFCYRNGEVRNSSIIASG